MLTLYGEVGKEEGIHIPFLLNNKNDIPSPKALPLWTKSIMLFFKISSIAYQTSAFCFFPSKVIASFDELFSSATSELPYVLIRATNTTIQSMMNVT